ncbi:MAG: threonine ammonia-lyase [Thermodesulfobacteriota bacterium]
MLSIEKFHQAQRMLAGKIIRTPLVYSSSLSSMLGGEIFLKLENLQKTGSFKIRGATHKIIARYPEIKSMGVVAASAGNHAQGVAQAASQAGLKATIVMPEWASISKQEATRAYGGDLILFGRSITDSLGKALELSKEGRMLIHPFDDEEVIIGQGTVALEIFEETEHIKKIVVPVGGGGLIAGIAAAAKALDPKVSIVGAQAAVCPGVHDALRSGRMRTVSAAASIADGISVTKAGRRPFAVMKHLVDDIALATEEEIASAILILLERKKILAEGAGAVSLAVLLSRQLRPALKGKTVLVISGGNVDTPLLDRVLRKGLVEHGRVMRLWVYLSDRPGSLAQLLTCLAEMKANVLHIRHSRNIRNASLYLSRVELELETRGRSHLEHIAAELNKLGYRLDWE